MFVLALSTSTSTTEIALVSEEKIVFEKSWPSHYNEAEKLLPSLQAALLKVSQKSEDSLKKTDTSSQLMGVFVVAGPGSFTGLRIGVTIANSLAFYHDVPLFSVSTFEYLYRKLPSSFLSSTVVLLKAGGEFVALKKRDEVKHELMPLSELDKFFDVQKDIRFILTDIKLSERKQYPLPKKVQWFPEKQLKSLGEVVQEYLREKPTPHTLIEPIYLKAPVITKSKKTNFTDHP